LPDIVVRLPELPGTEIVVRTSFWRRATILQVGRPLQRASGRRGPYVLPMPDGTQRTIKIVGTLNSSVVIDGRTYPIERHLRPYEFVLAAIPLVLAIPGFTGVALGFGGVFANARLARSSARLPLRLFMMIGTSVLLGRGAARLHACGIGLPRSGGARYLCCHGLPGRIRRVRRTPVRPGEGWHDLLLAHVRRLGRWPP
jgi:hypothetical protein